MTHSYDEIQNKYKELPEDVQEAMSSVDTTAIIREIQKDHSLHFDQTGALSEEVGSLMLGFTHPQNFVKSVKGRLNLDEEKARKIAEAVNEKIFKPVRASLMEIHGMKAKKEEGGSEVESGETDTPKKGVAESKLSGLFNVPKPKNANTKPDPYRESVG